MQYTAVGEALAALLTKHARELHQIAERICRVRPGDAAAADVVADVVLGFITGAIVRDERPLAKQLTREVAREAHRVRRERIVASQKLTPLDEDTIAAEDAEPSPIPAETLALAALVRQLAKDDPFALQLSEVYAEGGSRRRHARSGMSVSDYRSARKRLREYGARARAMLSPKRRSTA